MMDDRLTFEMLESDIGCVGQPAVGVAENHALAELQDSLLQVVAQRGNSRPLHLELRGGEIDRLAQSDDAGNVFRAGAAAPLLWPATDQRLVGYSLAQIERTDAL